MSKSLSPGVRRQIIAFDPAVSAESVSAFCRRLGVTRASFYNVRSRYRAEGNAALHPRSHAPHEPARVFGEDTTAILLQIRQSLKESGWDYGARSIWWEGVDNGVFAGPIPSISTIHRILTAAGQIDAQPRKRPRTSYIRFQRASAMETWQLDGFEFTLFDTDRTVITVYQLIDDSTRFDVGSDAAADPENSTDAIRVVAAAIDQYGVPQEFLTDNGTAFNLSRRGMIADLEIFLCGKGCWPISGRAGKPTTQGKDERSHQTLRKVLTAHAPTTVAQARDVIARYRQRYNHARHHQGLPGNMTPAQAWDAAEHQPSDGTAIPIERLALRAASYRRHKNPSATDPLVVITRQNPRISVLGWALKVPTHLVGEYVPVITASEYALFDTRDGEEALSIPLPLQTTTTSRTLPLWQVHGARIRNPSRSWTLKHAAHEAEHYPSTKS